MTALSVVVGGNGASWEAEVLEEIHRSDRLLLHRRCLDLTEVLSLAAHADVAALSTDLPGLDSDAVHALQRAGVHVVGFGDPVLGRRLGLTAFADPGRLEAALDAAPEPASSERGAIIAVWGTHGAPGRSVLAASLASAWSESGSKVSLIDADAHGGSQAQMFALLEDASGLVAACRAANRGQELDPIEHSVMVSPGLRLVTGIARADMWAQVRPGPFQMVVDAYARTSDITVIDLGPAIDDQVRHLLEVADRVVIAGRADPVGLSRLVRSILDVRTVSSTASERGIVVVNRLRATSAWSERDVSDAVGRLAGVRPHAFIPEDPKSLEAAILRGQVPAHVDADAPFAAAVRSLAARLEPVAART